MKVFTNLNRRWIVVLSISALVLAACGSDPGGTESSSDDGVASLGGDAGVIATTVGDGASAEDLEAPDDPDEAFLLYDQCMEKQGYPTDAAGASDQPEVNIHKEDGSDGESDADDGRTERMVGPGGVEIAPEDMERFQKADEACRPHLANIQMGTEFTPEQKAAMEDALLKMEQCMHEKGFDGFQLNIAISDGMALDDSGDEESPDDASEGPPSKVDPEKVDQAMEECSKIFDEYPELGDVPLPGRAPR